MNELQIVVAERGNHSLFKSDRQEKLSNQFFCKSFAKSPFNLETIYNKKFSFLTSECKLQINFRMDRSILKDVCRGKLK